MKVKVATGFLLLIAMLLTACVQPIPGAPPPQVDTTPQQPEVARILSPLEKAFAGVGGVEALQNLSTLSIEASGVRRTMDEQFSPGVPDEAGSGFTMQLNYDIAGDNLRLDYTRQRFAGEHQMSEIITGELGVIDGQDALFGLPGLRNMTSDRWAAVRKQQRLLNPHLILREVAADPSLATESGEQLLDGSVHHLLVIEDYVAPITLYVNASTGHIAKAATMENDHLRRDVLIEVFYNNWQPTRDGLFFPTELFLVVDGEILHKEVRSAIEVNQPLDSTLFKLPEGASPTFDEDLAAWGEMHHQVYQSFAAMGFPRSGLQTNVEAEELARGVYHVRGGSHHSLVIEQTKWIVVTEAPLHEARSAAVIDWIKTTFPDKPIMYVIATHHHTDHSAGLRTYVAEGATVVLHEAAKDLFEEVFQAPSTILPDRLALNPVAATIETVPADGSYTIPDETQPVAVYPIKNTHAEDMVIIHVPNAGVVFVSDLYSPNPNATSAGAGGQLLHDYITTNGLAVSIIAGGHGATIAFEDFEALLGSQ
ncbi:MAG: MBL fold metallo-hydrolase [Anaerolineae bacterium]